MSGASTSKNESGPHGAAGSGGADLGSVWVANAAELPGFHVPRRTTGPRKPIFHRLSRIRRHRPDGQGTIPKPCVAGSIPARGADAWFEPLSAGHLECLRSVKGTEVGTPDLGSLSSRLFRATPRVRTPAGRQIEVRPTRRRQALAESRRPALRTLRQPPQRTPSMNQAPMQCSVAARSQCSRGARPRRLRRLTTA
jgi:hypothetical protein